MILFQQNNQEEYQNDDFRLALNTWIAWLALGSLSVQEIGSVKSWLPHRCDQHHRNAAKNSGFFLDLFRLCSSLMREPNFCRLSPTICGLQIHFFYGSQRNMPKHEYASGIFFFLYLDLLFRNKVRGALLRYIYRCNQRPSMVLVDHCPHFCIGQIDHL